MDIWDVRHLIYRFWIEQTRPPTVAEISAALGLSPAEVQEALTALDARHSILLEPGTFTIRMASPLSSVPTGFTATIGGKTYHANCAWDSLGIPAMLHADADVEAFDAATHAPLHMRVRGAQVTGDNPVIHYLLPLRRWYDDLIHT